MCGRFSLACSQKDLEKSFSFAHFASHQKRYNIAPTQKSFVVLSNNKKRSCVNMQWGFQLQKTLLINARKETLFQRKSFSPLMKNNRCLVIANAFYEWKNKKEGPWRFSLQNEGIFAMAGLYDIFSNQQGKQLHFAIITVDANSLVLPIHHRMPAILTPKGQNLWLEGSLDALDGVLNPFDAEKMQAIALSKKINFWKYDSQDCLTPRKIEEQLEFF